MKKLLKSTSVLLALACGLAWSQAPVHAPAPPLQGLPGQASKASGERFQPDQVKGKVTVVFYWSTGCAVCRDSLPELRANLNGWRDKPFALLTVNVDRNAAEWQDYERIATTMQKKPLPGLISLHQDGVLPGSVRLPVTVLLDAKGKQVARYEGRVAPEVWDAIADLLP